MHKIANTLWCAGNSRRRRHQKPNQIWTAAMQYGFNVERASHTHQVPA